MNLKRSLNDLYRYKTKTGMIFASNLRRLMDKNELRISDLIDDVDCSYVHLSDLRHGRRFPSENMLDKLCAAFDVSPDEFFKEYEEC
jgi:transcriptional regulator with XRE-family HTH domain